MKKQIKEKMMESLSAVLPITMIVLVLSIVLVPFETGTMMLFLFGALLLVVGMGLFQLGADMAMMPLGEGISVEISKTRNILIIAFCSFLVGMLITIAEPDLQVLARQVPSVPNMVMILIVALGVGVFLVISMLRIVFKISLSRLLLGFYVIVFAIAILFVPPEFLTVAFDSGGVTTGPITVPFIMAMGVGIASIRSDKDASNDSFGLIALCSLGPILAVLILGIFYHPDAAYYEPITMPQVATTRDLAQSFLRAFPDFLKEVTTALVPIIVVFVLLQLITKRYTRRQQGRMWMGFLYTFVGLVLFLTGVNVGFMPVGQAFGSGLAASNYKWLLIPLGMLIGYFIVKAEPAVQVLNNQVEDITNGAIPRATMNRCLSIGVAASVMLSMIRVLTGISILWLLIPGYIVALGLTFFVPKIFVGIAFDSGGVCSGPMSTTFLLPLAMGATETVGGNVMTDAFGVVAMVAMTPLIAVQLMGAVYKYKEHKAALAGVPDVLALDDSDEIIDYEEDNDE